MAQLTYKAHTMRLRNLQSPASTYSLVFIMASKENKEFLWEPKENLKVHTLQNLQVTEWSYILA